MIVLNVKNFEELTKNAIKDLEAVGFSTSAGSIAKLFLNIVNKNIADLYDTLTVNHLRAFLSTSDGDALDAIGQLLHCYRLEDEEDDDFRFRINNQCLVLATSNETAIRLTVLTQAGVENVVLKEYAMGAGTFSVIIIPNKALEEKEVEELKQNITNRLKKVHGYGIRYDVTTPTMTYLSLTQSLRFKERLPETEKQEIRTKVQTEITKYIKQLKIGEDMITDKLTQITLNVSNKIIEEINQEIKINGEKSVYVNQSCRWFEKFVPDVIAVV